jgi:hypothetical protein
MPKIRYKSEVGKKVESILKDIKEKKMIQLTIRLYTNVKKDGGLEPGHAYPAGTVRVSSNDLHNIGPQGDPLHFHSIGETTVEDDLLGTIIKALNKARITFVGYGEKL